MMETEALWRAIAPYFSKSEFKHPEKLNTSSLLKLTGMRASEKGIIITVNEDYAESGHSSNSLHGRGKAFDIVIKDADTREALPILDQFIIALRYNFSEVGFYPYWITPGLHVGYETDVSRRKLWYRNREGVYLHPLMYLKEEG